MTDERKLAKYKKLVACDHFYQLNFTDRQEEPIPDVIQLCTTKKICFVAPPS